MVRIAISCLQRNLHKRPSASMLVKVFDGLMDLEPVAEYSFLNSIHEETPQEIIPVASSTIIPSVLSGPR
ncbi:hypothetical protein Pint_04787 [Pistacia integerrima]|uniref:Uncharacterized protein n=1 Tax=Pistacia integerrima TaxID=434235 RepID=A0ACC0Z7V0_9ROSI|nr:hypothetical protein Pint_04787 [Pistacia integerrima]